METLFNGRSFKITTSVPLNGEKLKITSQIPLST